MKFLRFKNYLKRRWLLIVAASLTVAIGHFFAICMLEQAKNEQKNRLLDVTTISAASLDINDIKTISGGKDDANNPTFYKLKEQFVRMGNEAEKLDVIWIYSVLKEDPDYIFSFDSLEPGDLGYGPPGQSDSFYQKPPPELKEIFEKKEPVFTRPYTDEYGTYVSAFIPILDPKTNEVILVIGADMENNIYMNNSYRSILFPLISDLFAIVIICLIFAYLNRLKKSREITLQSMDQIEQEKFKTESVLRMAGEPIIVTDVKGIITYVNQAAQDVLKCSYGEMVGKQIFQVITVEGDGINAQEFLKKIRYQISVKKQKVQTSTLDTGAVLVCLLNGHKIPVAMTLSPIVYKDIIQSLIIVFNDISKIMEVDQMKSDFISLASHQLRTPLAKMKWMTEMLIDDQSGQISENQRDKMEGIYEINAQIIRLVSSLLNISRFESGHITITPSITYLPELLLSVINESEHLYKVKNIEVIKEINLDIPKLSTDPKLLAEAFKNLFDNAIKYTPSNGKITVRMYTSRDRLITEFSDSGFGIPEKDKSHIFQRFYRANNVILHETSGTGLGLYLVKAIVTALKGNISFESKENEGTTFIVKLPLAGCEEKEGCLSID